MLARSEQYARLARQRQLPFHTAESGTKPSTISSFTRLTSLLDEPPRRADCTTAFGTPPDEASSLPEQETLQSLGGPPAPTPGALRVFSLVASGAAWVRQISARRRAPIADSTIAASRGRRRLCAYSGRARLPPIRAVDAIVLPRETRGQTPCSSSSAALATPRLLYPTRRSRSRRARRRRESLFRPIHRGSLD